MRAVKAELTSSKSISLSKAAAVLSLFTASETGARPDVAAYLRRAAASFKELVSIHREIRHDQNISQKKSDKLSEEEDGSKHLKTKKKKEKDREVNFHGRNPILEQQGLGECLGNAPVEDSRVVLDKTAKNEDNKSRKAWRMTDSNMAVSNKKENKKEKEVERGNVKEDKKKNAKQSKIEVTKEEKESDVKRFEEMAHKRKKRKHTHIAHGGMDVEMDRPMGKRRTKRRKV